MRLTKISVDKLFGLYTYEINLFNSSQSNISIIDATNGKGKTTILNLIQASIKGDIIFIDSIPFSKFRLDFEKKKYIEITKSTFDESILSEKIINLVLHARQEEAYLEGIPLNNIKYIVNGKEHKVSIRRSIIPALRRRMHMYDNGEELSFADILKRGDFQDFLQEDIFFVEDLIDDLKDFSKQLKVYFIEANRLFVRPDVSLNKNENDRNARRMEQRRGYVSSVQLCKERIQDEIVKTGKVFADESEKLDRTFPQRVLDDIFKKNGKTGIYSKEEIVLLLDDLEKRRSELGGLGLITIGSSGVKISSKRELTDETKIFLSNYIEDNITKLKIYDELSKKLRLLSHIINERSSFSDKYITFNAEEGVQFLSRNGKNIPIDKLSSGEKNNLVLFYDLIFECENNTLVLVDEPEISLHVTWQRQFIDELNEICQMNNLQGIVATHSPDIVGDYEDYMIDLEDLNNE